MCMYYYFFFCKVKKKYKLLINILTVLYTYLHNLKYKSVPYNILKTTMFLKCLKKKKCSILIDQSCHGLKY